MNQYNIFRKIPILCALTFFTLACSVSLADEKENKEEEEIQCIRPFRTPSVPDARRSSESKMREAAKKVREYLETSAEYRDCLGRLLDKEKNSSTPQAQRSVEILVQDTLETEELLADLFNQQIRLYKSINSEY